MESYPIFLLELRQAARNRTIFISIVLGIVMGLYLLLYAFGNGTGFLAFIFVWIPFLLFPLSLLLVSLPPSIKIAGQLLNDDLILRTPLSPHQVLCEKLGVGLVNALILYLPTIPGAALCLIHDNSHWLFGCLFGFVLSLALLAVGLGFLSGAKTMLKTTILTFLIGVFLLAALVVGVGLFLFAVRFRDDFSELIWMVPILFTLLVGVIGFMVGFYSFRPGPYDFRIDELHSTIVFFVMFGIFISVVMPPFALGAWLGPGAFFFLFIADLVFLGVPFFAVTVSRWEP